MAYIIKHNENHFLFFLVYILPKTILKIFKPGDHEPRLTNKYSTRCRYGLIPSCLSARN